MKIYAVEATTRCNLKCGFCPKFKDWAKRPDADLTRQVLEAIPWEDTKYVELQLSGEPLLHPNLDKIVDYLHEQGVKVGFSTNGTMLQYPGPMATAEKADIVTVNTDRYKGAMKPNFFQQTLGDDFPWLKYDREPRAVPACSFPEEYCVVQADGDVVPCCHAHGKTVVFGNVLRESFEAIWYGTARTEFLRKLAMGKGNGLCEFCEYPNPQKIHKKLLAWLSEREGGKKNG